MKSTWQCSGNTDQRGTASCCTDENERGSEHGLAKRAQRGNRQPSTSAVAHQCFGITVRRSHSSLPPRLAQHSSRSADHADTATQFLPTHLIAYHVSNCSLLVSRTAAAHAPPPAAAAAPAAAPSLCRPAALAPRPQHLACSMQLRSPRQQGQRALGFGGQ
jgi:hypothetical protein